MENTLAFLNLCAQLKTTQRKGWQLCGVARAESVADHSFQLALMAFVMSQQHPDQLNQHRCVALALVHDLGEAIIGDITPHDGVSKAEKFQQELGAMQQLSSLIGSNLIELWQEYERGASAEAKFVKSLDKLEMLMQAKRYGQHQPHADLEAFWRQAQTELDKVPNKSNIPDPWVRGLVQQLLDSQSDKISH